MLCEADEILICYSNKTSFPLNFRLFPSGCSCTCVCILPVATCGTCGISLSPQLPVHFTRYTKLKWAHFHLQREVQPELQPELCYNQDYRTLNLIRYTRIQVSVWVTTCWLLHTHSTHSIFTRTLICICISICVSFADPATPPQCNIRLNKLSTLAVLHTSISGPFFCIQTWL